MQDKNKSETKDICLHFIPNSQVSESFQSRQLQINVDFIFSG